MRATVEENTRETFRQPVASRRTGDLEPGRGEAAWLGGAKVAVYRTEGDEFFAAAHHCPVHLCQGMPGLEQVQ